MIKVNKPKIRFNEFENIWTKSKLGELYEIYSGNTPSRSDSRNYQNGEIPWIKTTDLNNSIICSNEEKISVYGATKLKVLPEKSVLIAMYGGFNQIGRTGLLAYPATINQALAALMPVNEINPNFLLNFLNFKKESWRNVAASSRKDPNITKNDVEKFKISFPSLDEQSAIGSLFRTLDDLLASYKDNLTNYQSLKATMLSKMFPKAGQTVPEIRLDGFEGEWKKETLEPYLTESRISGETGLTAKKITVKLWGKGVIEKEEKYAGSSNTQYFIRKAGQFIYSKLDFQNQAFGIIPNELDGYQSTLDLPTFDIQNIDPKFLLEYVMRREFYEYQGLIANGSRKAKRIHPEDFLVMPVRIPSLEEQQAMGSYFSNIDNFINAYQEKISQLETLKKKLLQDMFI
ncbi:restriction endonuclease subunit S [Streptococcus sp. V869]